jgi:transcriptional regulator with XRE-family HTH domain
MRPYTSTFDFGKNLKILRKKRGITQSELAEKAGLTLRAISYYETENKYPPTVLLSAISRVLEISMEELLGVKKLPELPKNGRVWNKFKTIETMSPRKQKQVFDFIHLVKNQK